MEAKHTTKLQIMLFSGFLSSQFYVWLRGVRDRKRRHRALYAEQVDAALDNILDYPHMGGKKGALMLAYHQVEYIGQRAYDMLKRQMFAMLIIEIKQRQLLKEKPVWRKPKAVFYGEIWCADFTEVNVFGLVVYIAVVLDAFSHYYLGYHVSDTADFDLVDGAFKMALKTCQGVLPAGCMVNDNGGQYKSDLYTEHLAEYGIEQVFIPKGTPWNNGEAEVGMKDIKALFYHALAKTSRQRRADRQKILAKSATIAGEIFKELNEKIPRLKLGGVTPLDVVTKKADEKREMTEKYISARKQERRHKTPLKDMNQHIGNHIHLGCLSNLELKNMYHLINRNYKHIVPEGVG